MDALTSFGAALLLAATPAPTLPMQRDLILVQVADCYTIGEQQAAAQDGTLAAANDAVQNGQPVCRVIIVVPGQNGERPKRVEIIVPKG